ncbi:MAG: 3-hydroxybutyryl-CoA dehydrogenase, partial [Saprospiraceae bacterium]|nr:3-hydroxybutyryl-CoA dehydrogenase [Saprospiraceae bacterium]
MKVGIIGAGTMGRGIAQVAATSQCETILYDSFEDAIASSNASHEKIFNRLIEKGRMTEDEKESIQSRLTYTSNLELIAECDLVIEAIIEDLEIKKKVFQEIENLVSEECIIASNTSSLSITSLAASLDQPERFIGIHFFNPAPLMKLVEIVPAIQTEKSNISKIKDLVDGWGKTTVLVKDTPGFIVNKVARPFYSEALRIYEEGIADFATIDEAMRSVGGFRMGPFELMDFIGNDVNYAVTESVWTAFYYDPRYKPAFTQKRLSEAGYLGRKSGRGYYDYSNGVAKPEPSSDDQLLQYIANRIVMMLINEAADTLHTRIATLEDIDMAMTRGVNYPKGLLQWADEIGIETVVQSIDALYEDYHEDRY